MFVSRVRNAVIAVIRKSHSVNPSMNARVGGIGGLRSYCCGKEGPHEHPPKENFRFVGGKHVQVCGICVYICTFIYICTFVYIYVCV